MIVRDARECDLPDVGVVTFVDLESGEEVEVDTSQVGVREAYASQAQRRHHAVEQADALGAQPHLAGGLLARHHQGGAVARGDAVGDLEQQGQKFMQILAVAVGSLTNLPMLVPIVQQLGVRHASYGVTQEHYDTARDALMWTLAMVLQDRYTDEVRSAWVSAYAMLAGIMKEAAWGKP